MAQAQSQTPMFTEQIEDVFGDFISDGRIQCSAEEFNTKLEQLLKQMNKFKKSVKSTRKTSNFMNWLSSERRSQIKDEFFDDYETNSDWSVDGIRAYYTQKGLPLEKLNALIQKKEDSGKEVKKPRLMSLITIKAGLIWSDMTDSEKEEFKVEVKQSKEKETDDNDVENTLSVSSTKKGRPSGYKAKQFASNHAVMESIKNAQDVEENNDDSDSVELEMFMHEDKEYFKDDEDNVYNEEYEVIGKIRSDGKVIFN